jgi:transcriptional regulator with XRE-family HTH domain
MTGNERRLMFKASCEAKKETQAAVCRRWDYTVTHITDVLKGTRAGSAGLKDRIAQYVGVPFDEFWGSDGAAAGSSVEEKTAN